MRNHSRFISSPITEILKDAVSACAGIGNGIETYPLCEYIMQSVFIKMAGSQEQKMKCICWEMATDDYVYRYEFTQKPLGECSKYEDKQKIYISLIKQIEKHGVKLSNAILDDKKKILESTFADIDKIFLGTNLVIWAQNDFLNYKEVLKDITETYFANNKGTLFTHKDLKELYENHFYIHRNRIAHNTQSYQQNLPTLKTLISDTYKYKNYFVYFFVIILIDKIFIELYDKYLLAIDNSAGQ